MNSGQTATHVHAGALLCLALCLPSWAMAAGSDDFAKMELAQKKEEFATQPAQVDSKERDRLEQRVKELEIAKTAQEDAVRSIIRSSISTLGSKINAAALAMLAD